ncbi:MAG: histidinol-phosphate transaminase [Campylobacterota bacterium]|nr:histidinol-phosphate transaminase [Campylobacterota bacterium]
MKFNKELENIKSYEAGKPIELVVREYGIEPQNIIKLASNENPNGCSQKVQDGVAKIVSNMSLYPDDSMLKLKNALSKQYNIDESELIIGAGSDQIIEFIVHATCSAESKILMNSITFAMYQIYADHVGASTIRTTSVNHDLEQFYNLYAEHKPSIIFICTPNNPTGDAIKKDELYRFLKRVDSETLVVVDGAYMEYAIGKDSKYEVAPSQLIKEFENVIYLGTFSKAYGLGGMRIGYGISNAKIIKELYKIRPPFNITTLSLEAAALALEDIEFVEMSIKDCFKEMIRYEEFAKEMNLEFIESYTNFITLLLNSHNSSKIAQTLLSMGIIIRDLSSYNLNAIRITIGKSEQNSRLFNALRGILSK